MLDLASAAMRFRGSVAILYLCSGVMVLAPFFQASERATTWSIWRFLEMSDFVVKFL